MLIDCLFDGQRWTLISRPLVVQNARSSWDQARQAAVANAMAEYFSVLEQESVGLAAEHLAVIGEMNSMNLLELEAEHLSESRCLEPREIARTLR